MNKHIKKSKPAIKTPVQPIPAPIAQTHELLTVNEVASILRVDGTTVRRWVKEGALEAVILPHPNERRAYRIKREAVDKILGTATHA